MVEDAQQVHVGDSIVTINDVGGDHRAMEIAAKSPGTLELTVVQGTLRRRSRGYMQGKAGNPGIAVNGRRGIVAWEERLLDRSSISF